MWVNLRKEGLPFAANCFPKGRTTLSESDIVSADISLVGVGVVNQFFFCKKGKKESGWADKPPKPNVTAETDERLENSTQHNFLTSIKLSQHVWCFPSILCCSKWSSMVKHQFKMTTIEYKELDFYTDLFHSSLQLYPYPSIGRIPLECLPLVRLMFARDSRL